MPKVDFEYSRLESGVRFGIHLLGFRVHQTGNMDRTTRHNRIVDRHCIIYSSDAVLVVHGTLADISKKKINGTSHTQVTIIKISLLGRY